MKLSVICFLTDVVEELDNNCIFVRQMISIMLLEIFPYVNVVIIYIYDSQ